MFVRPQFHAQDHRIRDVGVVKRRVHLVENADGRRVGQKHGENDGKRGQGLLAARQKRQRLQFLPGGWARISSPASSGSSESVRRVRRSAAEQDLEQILEMRVDVGKAAKKLFAPLPVQLCDGGAKLVDRRDEVLGFGFH